MRLRMRWSDYDCKAELLILSTTWKIGTKGGCLVLKKSGPLTLLIVSRTSANIPPVPASVGFATSGDVDPLINVSVFQKLVTRFAIGFGVFLVWVWPLQDNRTICPHKHSIYSNGKFLFQSCSEKKDLLLQLRNCHQLHRYKAGPSQDERQNCFNLSGSVRRKPRALNTSCELSKHLCSSRNWKVLKGNFLVEWL